MVSISKRWKEPQHDYRDWHRHRSGNDFSLGAVRLVQVQPDLWVQWLTALARHARRLRASVDMPRIGCGLAGGTWDKIEPIVIRTLCERDVPAMVDDFG